MLLDQEPLGPCMSSKCF